MSTEAASSSAARLRESLHDAIADRGAPLHPDMTQVLGGGLDPSARDSDNRHGETITAELRSVESALAYYTIEGLFVALSPLGMLATAFAMLQTLSGDHGLELTPEQARMFDAWGELAPFREIEIEADVATTAAEECRRALWHVGRVYDALLSQAAAQ